MSDWFTRLVSALLPEICALCRAPCSDGFCQPCSGALRRVADPCPRCALPDGSQASHRCESVAAVDGIRAPLIFEAPLSDCIHEFKYRRRRALGRALALLLESSIGHLSATDALIPVPLHPSRLRERTFNQADELAITLAARAGLRLMPCAAQRTVATPPQAQLGTNRRAQNLRGAFRITGHVAGLAVTIVDDVVTTGATVGSLASALRAAGARRVDVWAVARALPAGHPAAQAGTAGARPPRNT